jgi:hypothetical protein
MMEALHAGVPVLATDGWPMNELVEHGRNGMLVPALTQGPFYAEDHVCVMPDSVFEPQVCGCPFLDVGEILSFFCFVACCR